VIYLSLGSNQGDREAFLKKALAALEEDGLKIKSQSRIYETEPYGKKDQCWFLNMCVEINSTLTQQELMVLTQKIEKNLGRERTRTGKWAPRTVDIDIVLFNDQIIETSKLTIPHSDMHRRRFVLEPLAEIAPSVIHPVFKKSIKQLLNECDDHCIVRL
jgi:2-amino-4-hydroxy-6-hydroxymethyldihydropteridine diphosphokinase